MRKSIFMEQYIYLLVMENSLEHSLAEHMGNKFTYRNMGERCTTTYFKLPRFFAFQNNLCFSKISNILVI